MKTRAAWIAGAILACSLVFAPALYAQDLPRRTECLQWDQAYGQAVLFGMIGAALAAIVLGLMIGFMAGRQAWWAASPRARIWIAAMLIVFPLTEFIIVAWPRTIGFGRLLFSAVDPRYVQCTAMSFGAPGLLNGLIGEGVAAYGQWQVITGLLVGACAVGALVAWIISEAIVRSSGLESSAQAGEL
jgi:hypothetical protein